MQRKAKILDRLLIAMQDFNARIEFTGTPMKTEFTVITGYEENSKKFKVTSSGKNDLLEELDDVLFSIVEGGLKQ
jgi:hypothetical protein